MIVDKIELDEDEKSISDYYNKNTMRSVRNESRKKIEKVNKYIKYIINSIKIGYLFDIK